MVIQTDIIEALESQIEEDVNRRVKDLPVNVRDEYGTRYDIQTSKVQGEVDIVLCDPDPEFLGKAAYEAYRRVVGAITFNGDLMPKWDEILRDKSKTKLVKAWEEAGKAARHFEF